MKQLILGSQSPRRREILSYFNLPFEQRPSDYNEEEEVFRGDPVEYVTALSAGKALNLHHKYPQATILTADTIVYKEGAIYGKPKDRQDAMSILSSLQGAWHQVYTSLSLNQGHQLFNEHETTNVLFNPLTPKEIELYVDQLEWSDKAGGYAIQTAGSLIVKKIEGCYYNVMGMPVNTLRNLLLHIGVDLWERLAKQ